MWWESRPRRSTSLALSELGVSADRAAMVGDDVEADVGGAMDGGLAGILVRTGKHREDLVRQRPIEPTATVDSIADVPALISGYRANGRGSRIDRRGRARARADHGSARAARQRASRATSTTSGRPPVREGLELASQAAAPSTPHCTAPPRQKAERSGEHVSRGSSGADRQLSGRPSVSSAPATAGLDEASASTLLAGGKRIRLVALATARAIGIEPERVLPASAAIELIHTYSLIHDDLPAMDDDEPAGNAHLAREVRGECRDPRRRRAVRGGDAAVRRASGGRPGARPRRAPGAGHRHRGRRDGRRPIRRRDRFLEGGGGGSIRTACARCTRSRPGG